MLTVERLEDRLCLDGAIEGPKVPEPASAPDLSPGWLAGLAVPGPVGLTPQGGAVEAPTNPPPPLTPADPAPIRLGPPGGPEAVPQLALPVEITVVPANQ